MIEKYALANLLPAVLTIARQAGEKILEIANRPQTLSVSAKEDNSPVTEADLAAQEIIHAGLLNLTPSFPQLSEESATVPFEKRSSWEQYWLIDPLDGTKEFIAGTNEYTINIALIQHGKPILGVIYSPVTEQSYAAIKNNGCYFQEKNGDFEPVESRPWGSAIPAIAISRRHQSNNPSLLALLDELGEYTKELAGSSLKFCLLATGRADIYPRLGPTSEWDTAAGQIILEEAGGAVLDLNGKRLQYNTKESLLNPPFIAVGDAKHDWGVVLEKIRTQMEGKN